MEIKIQGELTVAELRQAIYEELHKIEEDLAISHTRGATLFVHPTNGLGESVVPHNKDGARVRRVSSDAPYRSVADQYKIK